MFIRCFSSLIERFLVENVFINYSDIQHEHINNTFILGTIAQLISTIVVSSLVRALQLLMPRLLVILLIWMC